MSRAGTVPLARLLAVFLALVVACASPPKKPDPVVDEATSEELLAKSTTALFGGMMKMPAENLQDLLEAESHLPVAVSAELLRYSVPGAERARAMIKSDPQNADAHLLLAVHLAIQGLAKGKTKSFFEGTPSQVIKAFEDAARIDKGAMSAGPLQIQGRFRTVVPFPYRDVDLAQSVLAEAAEIAPVKQTLFYLGDAYAWQGDLANARTAWNRSLRAKLGPTTLATATVIDQLVKRRLEMAAGD
jgi:hypothetical protein